MLYGKTKHISPLRNLDHVNLMLSLSAENRKKRESIIKIRLLRRVLTLMPICKMLSSDANLIRVTLINIFTMLNIHITLISTLVIGDCVRP